MQGPPWARRGAEMRKIGLYRGGAVLTGDCQVLAAGLADVVGRRPEAAKARVIDARGGIVLPGFVDSHAHPVFAEPRLRDFEMRLGGVGYEEIAAAGGGILSSVDAVRGCSEDGLASALSAWAGRFIECGTTTLEAKSGYGLDLDSELKMLRAVARVGRSSSLELVPTFLGAHAVAPEHRRNPHEYVRRLCSEMIPSVARQGLARFVDAFCENNYFSQPDAELVLRAGMEAGLGVKVHAEQLSRSGGAALAARLKAVSADHLDRVDDSDIDALKDAGVVATLLPACNYFLGLGGYPPARRLIDRGAAVALATDFNPGTAPCWNMQMVLSLACTQMKMSVEEALTAATINGAHALGLGATHGSLEPGKQADLLIFDVRDYRELPYYFGGNQVSLVMKKGTVVHSLGGREL